MRNVIDETKWNTETDFFTRRALREAEIGRFFSSYPNVAQGGLRDYSDWLFEQSSAGLPTNIEPPSDVEPREAWRTRIIGTSDSLPPTRDASHVPYRGSERNARAVGLAAYHGLTITASSEPARPPKLSIAERAWRFVASLTR
jgi:hypothetical protein